MKPEITKNLSLVIICIAFVAFVYGLIRAVDIVNRTKIGTSKGTYTSYVTSSEEIKRQAFTLTKNCQSEVCIVQKLLDFTTNIPYQTKTFQQKSPQKTIQENFGDCDDKSNLLISMLHALEIEAYFVLVPKHIFVIASLESNFMVGKKGIWVNGKKYYILESTARNSRIGYPLQYKLNDIDVIIEPFSNKKIEINSLEYKL